MRGKGLWDGTTEDINEGASEGASEGGNWQVGAACLERVDMRDLLSTQDISIA